MQQVWRHGTKLRINKTKDCNIVANVLWLGLYKLLLLTSKTSIRGYVTSYIFIDNLNS